MPHIRQITIAGFRGILPPLSLPLTKNGTKPTSLVLFGRNGYGKSSITDAWEWFHTGTILRLRREGAGERAFPHKAAGVAGLPTYVEIEFVDPKLGTGKLAFDPKRVTRTQPSGGLLQFRTQVPHPCHIRYEDLSRFVYLTKADQYDALSELMGFAPQVEFQKSLKWVLNKLTEGLQERRMAESQTQQALLTLIAPAAADEGGVIARSNEWLALHGVEAVTEIGELPARVRILRERIQNDPRARRLAHLEGVRIGTTEAAFPDTLLAEVEGYIVAAKAFKRIERSATDLLLISLYSQGQRVLQQQVSEGASSSMCPLCGKDFGADLLVHLEVELATLNELKSARDSLDVLRRQLVGSLRTVALVATLRASARDTDIAHETGCVTLIERAKDVEASVSDLQVALRVGPEKLTEATLGTLRAAQARLAVAASQFNAQREEVAQNVASQEVALRADEGRARLVADYTSLNDTLGAWDRYSAGRDAAKRLNDVHVKFAAAVDDYIATSIADVQGRLEQVSSDVERYFAILEAQTTGLTKPALRLIPDQDRAVTLEIEFRGEVICPAYKYLSESQLNSFGLSLFLASARRFNGGFKFLLLDDVVNSFDAYKRPQVITLLKSEFADFQTVILTHDTIWFERLCDAFKGWVRKRITRYDPGTGPVLGDGFSDLEKIESDLLAGDANAAGRAMGPLLERELQELCERFEVLVTYNQRNEYTLKPLLERLRVRVKEKLTASHTLNLAIEALEADLGFRNLCAHWKNPTSDLTPEEIQIVVDKWKAISALVRCTQETCLEYARYDRDRKCFACGCGAISLSTK